MEQWVKKIFSLAAGTLILGVCMCSQETEPGFLGSSVIECKSFYVSPKTEGELIRVDAEEGTMIDSGDTLGLIDTQTVSIKMAKIESAEDRIAGRIGAKRYEVKAIESEIKGVARNYGRVGNLAEKGAMSQRSKDDLGTELEAVNHRLKAKRFMLRSLMSKKDEIQADKRLLEYQLEKSWLISPDKGVVSKKYLSRGEAAAPGKPIFRIYSADSVYADFFVDRDIAAELGIGQEVDIRVKQDRRVEARITWINDEAEYTPANIQTREKRSSLVYRVRARAASGEGLLKKGLPVEIYRK